MKKITLYLLFAVAFFAGNNHAKAQAPTPPRLIYGSSPFQDSLWAIDSAFWNVVFRNGPTLPGFTITGMNGLAFDPTTYETYIIMKVSGVTGRVLGKINLTTGVCTQVGNLGTNFSSLTFDGFGQLYGATGNGATPAETLFKIDKTNGTTTLMYAMGTGADGEIICYNRFDDYIYHWSGNGTVEMEKMARTDIAYTPISITVSGTPSGETFGALYLSPSEFIISNISSNFRRAFTNGFYPAAALSTNPDDLRGLVMPPQFTSSSTTICEGETFYADAGSLQLFDSVTYYWGDGSRSAVALTNMGLDGASHVYTVAGTYTVNILLDNGFVRDTFPTFYTVNVNPTPVITLSGSAAICPGATNTLTGSGTGTLQWFMNGSILPGETTNTYATTLPGVYNLYEINTFGCADSAMVGLVLVNVLNPTVTATSTAAAICAGAPVTLTGGGASTYVWDLSVLDGIPFNPTGTATYNVIGTDINGCTNTASIAVTVNTLPVVNITGITAACFGSTITLTGSSGGTSQWYFNGAIIPGATSNTYVASASGVYNMIKTNLSGCNDSAATGFTLTIHPLPAVTANSTTPAVCAGDMITLTGGGASTYIWSNSVIDGVAFAPTSTLTYTVTGTDINSCTNTATTSVTFNTVDVTTTTSGATITATAIASTYLWITCPAGSSTGITTQSYTPTANGSYAVVVTTGSCSDTSACVTISTIGINEYSQNNAVQVFPNPSNGNFAIQSSLEGTYTIVNELGQVLKTIELNSSNDFTMNIQNLNPGVYIVTGINKNSVVNKRIVITK